jgi:hypothetical protein
LNGKAKISYLWCSILEEDIGCLDISVNDIFRRKVNESSIDIPDDGPGLSLQKYPISCYFTCEVAMIAKLDEAEAVF